MHFSSFLEVNFNMGAASLTGSGSLGSTPSSDFAGTVSRGTKLVKQATFC